MGLPWAAFPSGLSGALCPQPGLNHRPCEGSGGLLRCFSSWLRCIFSKRYLNLNPSCLHFSQFFSLGCLWISNRASASLLPVLPLFHSGAGLALLQWLAEKSLGQMNSGQWNLHFPPMRAVSLQLFTVPAFLAWAERNLVSSGWIPAGFLRFETLPLSSSNTWLNCPSLNAADGCCFKNRSGFFSL